MFPIIPASAAAVAAGNQNGIFGYGSVVGGARVSITNLVADTGVIATDTTGVGTNRAQLAACSYGEDKGIFGFGYSTSNVAITNLVSNAGVVATTPVLETKLLIPNFSTALLP